jgi:hypothetical protein
MKQKGFANSERLSHEIENVVPKGRGLMMRYEGFAKR